MSGSDAHFQQVRAQAGTIFDEGGIQAYLERLSTYDIDVEEYLKWSIRQPVARPERNGAASVVAMIQDSSLTDMRAVTELGNTLSHVVDNMIPLAQDKNRKFLVGCDSSALSLGQFKPISDEDDEDDDYMSGVTTTAAPVGPIAPSHPLILKLSTVDSSGGETSQPLTEPRLPRYVVPLGRLLVHDMRAIDDIPSDEQPTTEIDPMDRPIQLTNYAVVMDAASKARSIWIVYNRAPIDLEVGCQVESAPTDEEQMVLFPPGDNFDSAMVMPDVRMWRVASNLLSLDVVADHVATTKSSVHVVANPVPGDEAAGALSS